MMQSSKHKRGGPVTRPFGMRHLLRSCSGTSAIEFAFVALPFIALLLGIIDFSRFIWTQSTLQFAVERAARCAVVNPTLCGTTSQIGTYALSQQVFPSDISASNFLSAACAGSTKGISVSITKSFAFTVPQIIPITMTLKAQSCYPQ